MDTSDQTPYSENRNGDRYSEWVTIYSTIHTNHLSTEEHHTDSQEHSNTGNTEESIDPQPNENSGAHSDVSSARYDSTIQVDDVVRFIDPFSLIEDLNHEVGELKKKLTALEDSYSKVKKDLDHVLDNYIELGSQITKIGIDIGELRKYIQNLERKIDSIGSRSWINIVAETIGMWKSRQCSYNSNSICSAWNIGSAMANEIRKVFGEDSIVDDGGKYRINLEKTYHICSFCPLFRRFESR